jgi:tRNA uridine 5-carboxymethylaminomethyl modification enzyme
LHVGLTHFPGGRLGDPPSEGLSASLTRLGLSLGRLKTGTTPRLLRDSVDFGKTTPQPGDDPPPGFSFHGPGPVLPQGPCHLTYTNPAAHAAIREGFDRSPLFTGVIQGTGARYCPSIEDKVARFPEKERHQIFIEPEGLESPEVYPNGIPTSLPWTSRKDAGGHPGPGKRPDRAPGLRHRIRLRLPHPACAHARDQGRSRPVPGRADKRHLGLRGGRGPGTVGGAERLCRLSGRPPFLPGRDRAYMAVLVDDLGTLGTTVP